MYTCTHTYTHTFFCCFLLAGLPVGVVVQSRKAALRAFPLALCLCWSPCPNAAVSAAVWWLVVVGRAEKAHRGGVRGGRKLAATYAVVGEEGKEGRRWKPDKVASRGEGWTVQQEVRGMSRACLEEASGERSVPSFTYPVLAAKECGHAQNGGQKGGSLRKWQALRQSTYGCADVLVHERTATLGALAPRREEGGAEPARPRWPRHARIRLRCTKLKRTRALLGKGVTRARQLLACEGPDKASRRGKTRLSCVNGPVAS